MADKKHSQTPSQTAKAEEAARKQARLSQALKANMARRKGQARARSAGVQESAQTGSAQGAQQEET